MTDKQQHSSSKVFLILSLLLVPLLYFTGMTVSAIGPAIYVYLAFAIVCYPLLHDKHMFQMLRFFGLSPIAFCIIMTPIYFLNHLYHGTLGANAHTFFQKLSAWFDVMLLILAIGYMHIFAILMLFVGFYLFGGVRRQ
ncbi:hypothetical protein MNBD_GAMMA12-324 [hydrothermal vent metagenome]|uniref:Uncharacterized protein n=1 Tax=hydrothermal vent metagenome TaxID=652676 RepID=A0A3B0Y9L1_9ZZZZ